MQLRSIVQVSSRRGFTLVEMLIVVAIIASLAGVIALVMNDTTQDTNTKLTQVTLTTVRDAMVGSGAIPGYYADVAKMPWTVSDLLRRRQDTLITPLNPEYVPIFNPQTGRGWRGPYLRLTKENGARYADYLDPSHGFTTDYNDPTLTSIELPVVLDSFTDRDRPLGRPIVLQIPNSNVNQADPPTAEDRRHARLISAGPDGIIATAIPKNATGMPITNFHLFYFPAKDPTVDDLVLYLLYSDERP